MLRKFLPAILVFFLLLGCSAATEEINPENTEYWAATQIGSSDYSCITGESETHETASAEGTVYVKAFAHKIYNSEKDYIVTLTTTITASATDSGITLSSITGDLTEAESDGLTVSEHISGDTGTVVLYWNQMSVCHFQYRVSSDGSFELLSA